MMELMYRENTVAHCMYHEKYLDNTIHIYVCTMYCLK